MSEYINPRKKTILIVDDDRTIRTILSRMLQSEGFQVLLAKNGEECIDIINKIEVDGFLIDIGMPGIGGVELCKHLRHMEQYRITPIIFITALDEDDNLSEVFAAGATDFINKPINQVVLRSRLFAHLQRVEYFIEIERVRFYLNRYISNRTQRMVESYSLTGQLPSPEQHEVCVMFTDIRGFTTLSQTTEPETLFSKLNDQLGMQVNMVYKYGGYIDKFGGDGLMAIFDNEDKAESSCQCALEIIDKIKDKQNDSFILPVGIGLHLGKVLIGNIGSEEHLDYSAIGETVNLASRLCNHAEAMSIDASEMVVMAAKGNSELQFTAPLSVNIRGVKQPVSIYKVKWTEKKENQSPEILA